MIVDDQPRARSSLKALLATLPGVVIQEAANGQEAVEGVKRSRPDVVLMDVLMPVMDGVQATHAIKAAAPEIKIIVLSLYGEYQEAALAAGADRFLTKGCPSYEIFEAILSK